MSIPLIVFAGIYFFLFLLWIFLTIANVYHVMRYAYWTKFPLVLTFVYLFLSTVILVGTGWLLKDVDWSIDFEVPAPQIESPADIPDISNTFSL